MKMEYCEIDCDLICCQEIVKYNGLKKVMEMA